MTKELTAFDYSSISQDAGARLRRILFDVRAAYGKSVENMLDCGAELARAQAVMESAKCGGDFGKWLEQMPFSRATAYNMIAAFQKFGEHREAATRIDAGAIYKLSGDNCPKPARDKAIKIAGQHVDARVTIDDAKKLIESFTATETPSNGRARTCPTVGQPTKTPGKTQVFSDDTGMEGEGAAPVVIEDRAPEHGGETPEGTDAASSGFRRMVACLACQGTGQVPEPPSMHDGFDAFWDAAPNGTVRFKKARRAAELAYASAIKRIEKQHADPHGWLRARVMEYGMSAEAKGKFCPQASSWLNAGRYDDDPELWEEGKTEDLQAMRFEDE